MYCYPKFHYNRFGSPLSADFTQSPAGTVCKGASINFTYTGVGSPTNHRWLISEIPGVTGTTANFSYTFLSAGIYTIRHQVSKTGSSCNGLILTVVKVIDCSLQPTVTTTGSSVCYGSCATVTASGVGGSPPYTYLWSNGSTTQSISPCPTNTTTYTVTIKDTGGSTSTSTTVVTVYPAVMVTTNPTNITCSGSSTGSITATGSGGTLGYTYKWSNSVSGSVVSGLAAGSYTVTITDGKGCTATSSTVLLSPTPLLGQFTKGTAICSNCGCNEWLLVNASNGTPPYTYQWPDGYDKRYKNKICPGNYTIKVTDKNGCSVNLNLSVP